MNYARGAAVRRNDSCWTASRVFRAVRMTRRRLRGGPRPGTCGGKDTRLLRNGTPQRRNCIDARAAVTSRSKRRQSNETHASNRLHCVLLVGLLCLIAYDCCYYWGDAQRRLWGWSDLASRSVSYRWPLGGQRLGGSPRRHAGKISWTLLNAVQHLLLLGKIVHL